MTQAQEIARVIALLDGGEEGVEVDVQNGAHASVRDIILVIPSAMTATMSGVDRLRYITPGGAGTRCGGLLHGCRL